MNKYDNRMQRLYCPHCGRDFSIIVEPSHATATTSDPMTSGERAWLKAAISCPFCKHECEVIAGIDDTLRCPNCGAGPKAITICGTEGVGYSRRADDYLECLDCHINVGKEKFIRKLDIPTKA